MEKRLLGLSAVLAAGITGGFLWACGNDDTSQPPPKDGGTDGTVQTDSGTDSGDNEAVSCANYCTKVMARCTGPNAQYADQAECERMCAKLPLGSAGDTQGNTVACRQYHAGNTPSDTHCPHAGPYGGGVCGSRCESFCAIDLATCLGDAGIPDGGLGFSTNAECLGECQGWNATDPSTPSGPTIGNTLACREYHLRAANGAGAASVPTHCPHAATPADAGPEAGLPCK